MPESEWFKDFEARCIAHIDAKRKLGHPDYIPGKRIPLYYLENYVLSEFVAHFDLPSDFTDWLGGFGLLGRGIGDAKKRLAAAKEKHNETDPARLAKKRFEALKKAASVLIDELGDDPCLGQIIEQTPYEAPAEDIVFRARHMIAPWQDARDFLDNDPDDWPPIASRNHRFYVLTDECRWLVDQINEALAALEAKEIAPPAALPRQNDPDFARFCGNCRYYWTEILEREPVIGSHGSESLPPLVAFVRAAWLLVNGKSPSLEATRKRLKKTDAEI